jgi:hypothetical protein
MAMARVSQKPRVVQLPQQSQPQTRQTQPAKKISNPFR